MPILLWVVFPFVVWSACLEATLVRPTSKLSEGDGE
jgi:hypothetical protein